jgi:hypothetical protein
MALEDTLSRLAEQKRIYLLVRSMVQAHLAGCGLERWSRKDTGIATDGWFVGLEQYRSRITVPEHYGTTTRGRWVMLPHVLKAIDRALAWNGQGRCGPCVSSRNVRHVWFGWDEKLEQPERQDTIVCTPW